MNRTKTVPLCCPACGAALLEADEALTCTGCAGMFPLVGGIPQLCSQRDRFFCEFTREDMRDLLAHGDDELDSALMNLLRRRRADPRLGEYIMGLGRAGWKYLLPTGPSLKVLDLGCGWGTLARSLADTAGTVVACDSTMERMQFLHRRARREHVDNLYCVAAGDGKRLPFPDDAFDLVVLNGVLEWVPAGLDGNPRERQLKFLQEIRRVTRPGGVLFVGIENRFAWKTWFLQPDGHTGLRFVPWLPRRLADLWSRLNRTGPYRVYLYGKAGYQRLFREAGFTPTRFQVPLPGYHHPSALVPAGEHGELRRLSSRPERRAWPRLKQAARGMLTAYFPDAFNIFSGAEASPEINRFLAAAAAEGCAEAHDPGPPGHYRMNGEMGMVTVLYPRKGFVLKVPLHQGGQDQLAGELRRLGMVHRGRHALSSLLGELVPRVLYEGVHQGLVFGLISLLPGRGADRLGVTRLLEAGREAASILGRMHGLSLEDHLEASAGFSQKLHAAAAASSSLGFALPVQPAVQLAVERIRMRLGVDVPMVYGHGDFKAANLLADPVSGRITGILDWGAGLSAEAPGYDLCFLAVDLVARLERISQLKALEKVWQKGLENQVVQALTKAYTDAGGLSWDPELWWSMMAYQWMKRLEPLAAGWEARRFDFRMLDAMQDLLNRQVQL